MPSFSNLSPGDAAPWFTQRSFANPNYVFDTVAGRHIVLCFYGSASDPHSQAAINAALSRPAFFDDKIASFFGVSIDQRDEAEKRVSDRYPGYRYFWDFDGAIGRLYGAIPRDGAVAGSPVPVRRQWIVLDPALRVIKVIPFADDQSDIAAMLAFIDEVPAAPQFLAAELQAPVIALSNVFEPEFCRLLIDRYERHGGEESGFMRDVNGRTVAVSDHVHKRRRDHIIEDGDLITQTKNRFIRRVVPMIARVHQFTVTRMERYIVSCYAAEDKAHFRAHRDNTTKGTAHRRFAVSVNLNDDFDGGEVSFPEFSPRGYKPPVGGAVVFSCSLLHAVSQVTRGRRFAFLPFLYDDAAARIREANAKFLEGDKDSYQSRLGEDAAPT
jgi:predicted 2-oxoglutarate/Fe(II)-dependent dioxygenase YbiX/peroxiredoxin